MINRAFQNQEQALDKKQLEKQTKIPYLAKR